MPEPETDQLTVSFAETEPKEVAPSLMELTMPLVVITGSTSSASFTDTVKVLVVLVLLAPSVAVTVKLCEVVVS
jgi:hypothetical protein